MNKKYTPYSIFVVVTNPHRRIEKWEKGSRFDNFVELTTKDLTCLKSAIDHNREWGLDQKHTEALLKKLNRLSLPPSPKVEGIREEFL